MGFDAWLPTDINMPLIGPGAVVTTPSGLRLRVLNQVSGFTDLWNCEFVDYIGTTMLRTNELTVWAKGESQPFLPISQLLKPFLKCTCGCASLGIDKHSDYCDLYSKGE